MRKDEKQLFPYIKESKISTSCRFETILRRKIKGKYYLQKLSLQLNSDRDKALTVFLLGIYSCILSEIPINDLLTLDDNQEDELERLHKL